MRTCGKTMGLTQSNDQVTQSSHSGQPYLRGLKATLKDFNKAYFHSKTPLFSLQKAKLDEIYFPSKTTHTQKKRIKSLNLLSR